MLLQQKYWVDWLEEDQNFIFPPMWSKGRSVKLWNFGQAPSWASSVLMMSWSTPKMWLEAGQFGHLRSRVPDQLERTWQKDSQIFTTFTYILCYCFCPRILDLQRQELCERMNHPWIVSVEKEKVLVFVSSIFFLRIFGFSHLPDDFFVA